MSGSVASSRLVKSAAIVPLVCLSLASTFVLTGARSTGVVQSTRGVASAPVQRPAERAIEAPASVSAPDDLASGANGNAQIAANSSTNAIPSSALAAYQRAETVINSADKSCNLTWQLIAAIGRVESNHGRFGGNALDNQGVAQPGIYGLALNGRNNTSVIRDSDAGQYDNDTTFDRAVGPMQFIPSTWSVVGVDADNDGQRNPQDIDDAALASAVYLCSGDDDLSTVGGQRDAVYRYNHSQSYVDLVLSIMDNYLEGDFMSVPNGTTAAGYLVPARAVVSPPAFGQGRSAKKAESVEKTEKVGSAPEADAARLPGRSAAEPVDDQETPDSESPDPTVPGEPGVPDAPEIPDPQDPTDPDEDGESGDGESGDGEEPAPDPLEPAQERCALEGLVDDPESTTDEFDECVVLTLEAQEQCAGEGLVDDPESATDEFDECVTAYTTPPEEAVPGE